jgi:hypothetical protein
MGLQRRRLLGGVESKDSVEGGVVGIETVWWRDGDMGGDG